MQEEGGSVLGLRKTDAIERGSRLVKTLPDVGVFTEINQELK